jgi:hypothetical protein
MATDRYDRPLGSDDRPSPKDDRSLGTLLTQLTSDTSELVRQEIALAKAEMSEKLTQLGLAIAALVAGGLVFFGGFLVLLDAAVFGLGRVLEPYGLPALAALIVAIATMIVGIVILMIGRNNLKPANLTPSRTAQSLRRDKDLVKEQMQ